MILKKYLLLILSGLPLLLAAQTTLYTEQYRPQFHFSPATNWCNDPNGLLYNKGLYHLFYQHNPFGNVWGHMSWGHATSTDLTHWKHQPVAIKEENGVMIFSGTCVVDKNNTSGFGKNGKIPMVAVYTGHTENVNQSQCIAYSLDNGVSWTKYSGNPILDLHKKDFRDPKIFWYEPKKYWVMCLMFPVEHIVQLYASKNLKTWNHLSDFGPAGDTSGVWECPDLVQVPVTGKPNQKKWLLQMSQNASMQYFIGEFDGVHFINELKEGTISRPDYGPDYYAAITYNQLPASNLPTAIGWINNWNYANDIPTAPWKSAMSLPRNLSVRKINQQWTLLQQPIAALSLLRKKLFQFPEQVVISKQILPVNSNQFEMTCDLTPGSSTIAGIRLAAGDDQYFEIGYDAAKKIFYTDRSNAGHISFNEKFNQSNRFEKAISLINNHLRLHIYYDHSIIEIFVNDGEAVFTNQVFPLDKNKGILLFSDGGKTSFSGLKVWTMKSVW